MPARILHRANVALERWLPEQRLFLRSDEGTRFIRLRPLTQAGVLAGSACLVAWAIVATAILLFDTIGQDNARERSQRELANYEARLEALSRERDKRAEEAAAAQERFAIALRQVSQMQSALLASEERRRELEKGIGVIQATLKRTVRERDAVREQLAALEAKDEPRLAQAENAQETVETVAYLTDALSQTASQRDEMARAASEARAEADRIAYDKRLLEERHNEIFASLEEAVTISMEPLDKVFASAGLNADDLIRQLQRGYSGQGGPLGPLLPAVSDIDDPDMQRARNIIQNLDRINLYRLAVEKTPLTIPVRGSYRYTSGFGRRWGRMHEGVDLAGPIGTPIQAPADGVVVFAGRQSGYGNLIKIRHEFGIETRYGHLSRIRVKVGQKVSRGEVIGDMGNTGRSTGPHLHYEVRVNGKPVNPMTFIKAARNVF
ncbi:murein DD-endopeptidase MepM/ murein hydrolase activator NlpD [Albidovulum inexpectatum]|uniref:Murein DD-endopeptidase MepM/ murein hydrolase activator NlpD n=1 Tax=Albidovulum inexpectatum TaxID=196587 RepID=A0A2S5JJQ2_9RHOB|nr:M23 family metallopeptidase [Albidovulum inexpectatum]PPB81734.1 murein DD-endopeptidase MepM/ murein hydrolase activator NlpD [Albidovulum inexpectatum]